MADLTITVCRLVRATESEILTRPVGEAASEGQYMRLDATTGYLVKGNSTTPAEVGGVGGILIDDDAAVGMTATIALPGAIVDLGAALDGLAYNAYVYVDDTDATFADAAGTETKVFGQVISAFGSVAGDRLLRLVDHGITTPEA